MFFILKLNIFRTQLNLNEQIDSDESISKTASSIIYNSINDKNLLHNPLENFDLLCASSSYSFSQAQAIGIHKNLNNIASPNNIKVKKDNLKRKLERFEFIFFFYIK